jgi:endonuclease IV
VRFLTLRRSLGYRSCCTEISYIITSGLAGTVLVYKIAAALARKGASLDKVEELANLISENIATIGIGLEHCHVSRTVMTTDIQPIPFPL